MLIASILFRYFLMLSIRWLIFIFKGGSTSTVKTNSFLFSFSLNLILDNISFPFYIKYYNALKVENYNLCLKSIVFYYQNRTNRRNRIKNILVLWGFLAIAYLNITKVSILKDECQLIYQL